MKNPRTKLAFSLLAIATVAAVFWFFSQKTDLSQELERKPQKQQPQTAQNENEAPRQKEKQQEKQQQETPPTKTLREQARDLEIALTSEGEIDTSNWQTYRNRSCGLEVKLPKSWKLHQDLDCKKHSNKVPEGIDGSYLSISFRDPLLVNLVRKEDPDMARALIPTGIFFVPFHGDSLEEVEKKEWLSTYPKKKREDLSTGEFEVFQYVDNDRNPELASYLLVSRGEQRIIAIYFVTWSHFLAEKNLQENTRYQLYKKIFTQIIKSIKILD